MKVGILGQNDIFQTRLEMTLGAGGQDCILAEDRDQFVRTALIEGVDLVVIDWRLKGGVSEGAVATDLLKDIRRWFDWQLPVVLIHVPDCEDTILKLLTAGANDCHTGESQVRVLAARIDGLLQRMNHRKPSHGHAHGIYEIHPETQAIHVGNKVVKMTKKEFELANFLFENTDKLLSRRVLMARVWGLQSELYTRTVDAHMSRLRKKLSLFPENGWRLVSVYGRGYQLETVHEMTDEAANLPSFSPSSEHTQFLPLVASL